MPEERGEGRGAANQERCLGQKTGRANMAELCRNQRSVQRKPVSLGWGMPARKAR